MKPITDFFSELTDIDKGFVKTTVALFRKPGEVVADYMEDGKAYARPLKFVLISSSIHSLLLIVWNYFFFEKAVRPGWRAPGRIENFSDSLSGFTGNFFPFIMLITIVPSAVLLLKVLFYKKTLRELTVIMLYGFGLFWLITIPSIAIPPNQYSDLLEPLISFIIVYICFRNVAGGNFFVSLGKWIAVTVALIFCFFYFVTPLVDYAYAKITGEKSPVTYKRPDEVTAQVTPLTGISFTFPWKAVANDAMNRYFFTREGDSITQLRCMDENLSKLWETDVIHFKGLKMARLVKLSSSSSGFLLFGLGKEIPNARAPQHMLLLSEDGQVLYDKTFDQGMLLNSGITIQENILLLAGGKEIDNEINPVILTVKLDSAGKFSDERTFLLPRPTKRFHEIFEVSSSPGNTNLILSAYENPAGFKSIIASEITDLSVMRVSLDTAIHVLWENSVFKKITKYSPDLTNVKTVYDSATHTAIMGYGLSDEDVMAAKLFCVSSEGTLMWKREVLNGEYNFIRDIVSTNKGIYFCGSTTWVTPQHPFVESYRLAIAGRVSLDGKDYSEINFGKFRLYAGQYFSRIIVKDSTLKMFSGRYEQELFGSKEVFEIVEIGESVLK